MGFSKSDIIKSVFLLLLPSVIGLGIDVDQDIFHTINQYYREPENKLANDQDTMLALAMQSCIFHVSLKPEEIEANETHRHMISWYEKIEKVGDLDKLPTKTLPKTKPNTKPVKVHPYKVDKGFIEKILDKNQLQTLLDPAYSRVAVASILDERISTKIRYCIVILVLRTSVKGLIYWNKNKPPLNFPVVENKDLSKYLDRRDFTERNEKLEGQFKDYATCVFGVGINATPQAIATTLNRLLTALDTVTDGKQLSCLGLSLKQKNRVETNDKGGKETNQIWFITVGVPSFTFEEAAVTYLKNYNSNLGLLKTGMESLLDEILKYQDDEALEPKLVFRMPIKYRSFDGESAASLVLKIAKSAKAKEDKLFEKFLLDPATHFVQVELNYCNTCENHEGVITLVKWYAFAMYKAIQKRERKPLIVAQKVLENISNEDNDFHFIFEKAFQRNNVLDAAMAAIDDLLGNYKYSNKILSDSFRFIDFNCSSNSDGWSIKIKAGSSSLKILEQVNLIMKNFVSKKEFRLNSKLMLKASYLDPNVTTGLNGPDCFVISEFVNSSADRSWSAEEVLKAFLDDWKPTADSQEWESAGGSLGFAAKTINQDSEGSKQGTKRKYSGRNILKFPFGNKKHDSEVTASGTTTVTWHVTLVFSTSFAELVGHKLIHLDMQNFKNTFPINSKKYNILPNHNYSKIVESNDRTEAIKLAVSKLRENNSQFLKAIDDQKVNCVGFLVDSTENKKELKVETYFWTTLPDVIDAMNVIRPMGDKLVSDPYVTLYAQSMLSEIDPKNLSESQKKTLCVKSFPFTGTDTPENFVKDLRVSCVHRTDLNFSNVGTAWKVEEETLTILVAFATVYDTVLFYLYKKSNTFVLYNNMKIFQHRYSSVSESTGKIKNKQLGRKKIIKYKVQNNYQPLNLICFEAIQLADFKKIDSEFPELGFIYKPGDELIIFQFKKPLFQDIMMKINSNRSVMNQVILDYLITKRAKKCNDFSRAYDPFQLVPNGKVADFQGGAHQTFIASIESATKDGLLTSAQWTKATSQLEDILAHPTLEAIGLWLNSSKTLYIALMRSYDPVIEKIRKENEEAYAHDPLNDKALAYVQKIRDNIVCIPEKGDSFYHEIISYTDANTRGKAIELAFSKIVNEKNPNWKLNTVYGFAAGLNKGVEYVVVIVGRVSKSD